MFVSRLGCTLICVCIYGFLVCMSVDRLGFVARLGFEGGVRVPLRLSYGEFSDGNRVPLRPA